MPDGFVNPQNHRGRAIKFDITKTDKLQFLELLTFQSPFPRGSCPLLLIEGSVIRGGEDSKFSENLMRK